MDAESVRAFGELAAEAGEELWGAEIRLNGGASVVATVTEPRLRAVLVDGGEEDVAELVARVRKVVMPVKPTVNVVVEWRKSGEAGWRPEKYRVDEVQGNAVDAAWTLRCVARN